MAKGQRDKTKSKRANDHYRESRQDKMVSQQGRKGHKERDLLSWIFAVFVTLLQIFAFVSMYFSPIGNLAERLPVATNGLVLIECRVELFDGDITGYLE
jgi:hypothetical protein